MTRDAAAVVLAAGRGERMGGGNKASMPLGGEPVLAYSLEALAACPSIGDITVVIGAEDADDFQRRWGRSIQDLGAARLVEGGEHRWLSSRNGCRAADPDLPLLLVHDSARPLITAKGVEAVIRAARREGAALAAEPVVDTIKRDGGNGTVAETLSRKGLWRAQTPQAFRREILMRGFAEWPEGGEPPTDECMLVEAQGEEPVLVRLPGNFKITTPGDLPLAENILMHRSTRT
jgi:2-C-methyl-D-erythritol 4-phosphate cytidylyltransferase